MPGIEQSAIAQLLSPFLLYFLQLRLLLICINSLLNSPSE